MTFFADVIPEMKLRLPEQCDSFRVVQAIIYTMTKQRTRDFNYESERWSAQGLLVGKEAFSPSPARPWNRSVESNLTHNFLFVITNVSRALHSAFWPTAQNRD
jgi:hypothetical protein